MERQNCVRANREVKLPIGFRFHPTDDELVVHYLTRKAFGLPLPALVIPEFDVFKSHPQNFPGDLSENNRYFFSKRSRCGFNNVCKTSIGSGYWRPKGKERQILYPGLNQRVGTRRTLAFYETTNKSSKRTKSGWFMREYSLVVSVAAINQVQGMGGEEEWCVYNLFKRKTKPIKRKLYGVSSMASTIDFPIQTDQDDIGPPPASPPSSAEDLP